MQDSRQPLKQTITSCFVLLASAISLPSHGANCAPVPGDPVSFWAAEGNAMDSTGGNDGTIPEGVTFVPGQVDQAFAVDGTISARVEIPDAENLRFEGDFSIEAWVQTTLAGPGTFADIVRKRLRDLPQRNLDILLGMGNGVARFALSDDDNNNNGPAGIQSTTLINDGLWHYVVGVRDAAANQSRLYVDGVLEAQIGDTTTTFAESGGTISWNIGNNPGSGNFPWEGLIDEVGIFDRLLEEREIQLVYDAGTAGRCGLIILKDGFE